MTRRFLLVAKSKETLELTIQTETLLRVKGGATTVTLG